MSIITKLYKGYFKLKSVPFTVRVCNAETLEDGFWLRDVDVLEPDEFNRHTWISPETVDYTETVTV